MLLDENVFPVEQTLAIVYKSRDLQVTVDGSKPSTAVFECVPKLWSSQSAEIKWFVNNKLIKEELARKELADRRLVVLDVVRLLGRGIHSAVIRCEAKTVDGLFQEHADVRLDVLGWSFVSI